MTTGARTTGAGTSGAGATDAETTRAVVTGIGVAAPNGLGPTAYWRALMSGRCGIRRVTRFDASRFQCPLAGEIEDFEASRHIQDNRLLTQTDHITQMSLVAADWALRQAGLRREELSSAETGVVTAAASAGYEFGQRELAELHRQEPSHLGTYESFAWFNAASAGQISIRNGMRGAGTVLVGEQAGGLDAIGHARRQLRDGARAMLTGGVDSALSPWSWAAHEAAGSMSHGSDPRWAYLPFDERANGYVPGEGGAIMVLESAETAVLRPGARIYGEVAGYAATFDSERPDRPSGLRRAIEAALGDAGMEPDDIDVVFADAAGRLDRDRTEAEAITGVFGPCGVPVTAPKTMTGRLCAGGACLDVAAALLAMYWAAIPPTVNVRVPVPDYELDLVLDEPRRVPVRAALVLARGLGGFNSALIVREYR